MDEKNRQIIDTIADEVINIFGVSIPIKNMNEVVSTLGGSVVNDSRIDFSASGRIDKNITQKSDEKFFISVPEWQSERRKNFTIAHEIGHLFLHMGYMINDSLWNNSKVAYYRVGNSIEEQEANEFAAAFLMPAKEYKEKIDEYSDGDKVDIDAVAQFFNVSVDAATYRGRWLGVLKW